MLTTYALPASTVPLIDTDPGMIAVLTVELPTKKPSVLENTSLPTKKPVVKTTLAPEKVRLPERVLESVFCTKIAELTPPRCVALFAVKPATFDASPAVV